MNRYERASTAKKKVTFMNRIKLILKKKSARKLLYKKYTNSPVFNKGSSKKNIVGMKRGDKLMRQIAVKRKMIFIRNAINFCFFFYHIA